jgi:predicted nucleic acid-binding protein
MKGGDLQRLSAVLGKSEVGVALLASDLEGTVVIDEPIARKLLAAFGITVTGTLELLRECVRQNWHSDSDCMEIIRKLYAAGFQAKKPDAHQTFAEYCGGI